MTKIRKHSIDIRQFILDNVQDHPTDIAKFAANHFGITRQSISKHICALVSEKHLIADGYTSARKYRLGDINEKMFTIELTPETEEFSIWQKRIKKHLKELPENIIDLWSYSFQEILNNAIEHSEGHKITIKIEENKENTSIYITDDGVGIFNKLCNQFGFDDAKHAALEMSKGKLTTDPSKHTGQGIFFSSRMMDEFSILAEGAQYIHNNVKLDFFLEGTDTKKGTAVYMSLNNNSSRTVTSVFDTFESQIEGEYGFVKTIIPVKLAQYDKEMMVSRSQARRVMARVNRFKLVGLDFESVNSIGQAFADEIFRVFGISHPDVEIYYINANDSIDSMIKRALADAEEMKLD